MPLPLDAPHESFRLEITGLATFAALVALIASLVRGEEPDADAVHALVQKLTASTTALKAAEDATTPHSGA